MGNKNNHRTPSKPKHKLSGVPTAYEETHKLIDSKDIDNFNIEALEEERLLNDEDAILKLLNRYPNQKTPLIEKLNIKHQTYQQALSNLLSIRNHETFETMMLLFEYMEQKKTFKIDRLTGTELLKLGGYSATRQTHRDRILRRIEQHAGTRIKVLNPAESKRNYANKKNDKGLVYEYYDLIKIEKAVHSKANPKLIKELVGVEFLPQYIEYLQKISRRYLPLETIRQIKKEHSSEKTRLFLYKLCFKFAGMNSEGCELDLDDCMSLGKFYNKKERDIKRKWRPIEKALEKGKDVGLFYYSWVLREPSIDEIKEDKLTMTLFGEIDTEILEYPLEDKYFKYVKKVIIVRAYRLEAPKITLPFELEKRESSNPRKDVSNVL